MKKFDQQATTGFQQATRARERHARQLLRSRFIDCADAGEVGGHVRKHKVGAVACLSPLQTVLTILIFTKILATFGTEMLTGYGIGSRLEFLLIPITFAFGIASVPMVGVAIGA